MSFAFLVSILARPEGRALHRADSDSKNDSKFQSSPAPKGGRYLTQLYGDDTFDLFQSSPAPKGGRYLMLRLHILKL